MLVAPTLPPADFMVPPLVLELRAAEMERAYNKCQITGRVFGSLYGLTVRFNVQAMECQYLTTFDLWAPTSWWTPPPLTDLGAPTQ